MKTIRKISLALFAVMSMVSLTACGDFIKEVKKELGVGGEAETLTFYSGQFTAHKPDGWAILDDLNDQADLGMGNYIREAYALFLTEPKTDFDDGIDYRSHSDITRENMKYVINDYSETDGEEVTTDAGFKGVSYEIRGQVEGLDIIYLHVTVETDDHLHQILQWSLPKKYDRNLEDYNAVWKSIRPKKAARQPSDAGA